ncbi:MAG: PQQ-dependent sugar dehydrogenase [Thermodesulfovibrio sp.]|nr:PQQ-dependent sugar dehydrogenase [Thermodesulfovibrio sp.]
MQLILNFLLSMFISLLFPIAIQSKEPVELSLSGGDNVKVEQWIEGLEIPWSLVFLPDKRALISERPGRIRLIKDGMLQKEPYATIEVAHIGEGGLMGLAFHPDFPKKPYIYAMHTYRKGNTLFNRVIRLKDLGNRGVFDRVIIDNIPGARFHNGGRIAFGPDGMLYITTGEIYEADLAQNLNSLGGKILRITPEGEIPSDNPFKNSPIWSFGHRNPQGLAWHPETGDLFSSEHGPSGEYLRFGNDEINIIKKGGNYGWPIIIGKKNRPPYIDPLVLWEKTTPPSGITFYSGEKLFHLKGDLFVATLRSESIIRIKLQRTKEGFRVERIERWFEGKYGRIRDIVQGPDGYLYFLTNNRDGRGKPKIGDDRVYRIIPQSHSN